ncbi:MAG: exodeoxyribonuclease VII small subunit [Ignavibacteriae bacterium]|nr:MAG: exodeoxyribonuclease VII small subunit [Ignavibacteriota bacterium]
MKSSKNLKSFEECFSRLEKILERLESEDVTLDETIKLYEEGLTLTKSCYDKLTGAEMRIKEINKNLKGDIEIKEFKQ